MMALPSKTRLIFPRIIVTARRQGLQRPLSTVTNSTAKANVHEAYYNQEHQELQRSLKKLIETEINPYVDEWEAAGQWPGHRIFKLLGQAGFLGINKPSEYGGLNLNYKYHAAYLEALGHIRAGGVSLGIGVQTDVATPALSRFGSDYVKREFLAPAISGDVIACLGVSEPGAGSDVAGLQTTARHQGEDLIINGQKLWITNACQADWICILANTSVGPPHYNKSLICVPMKTPGVNVARKLDKLGMRSSDTGHIFFDEVCVPAKNIVGEEGKGFIYQMKQFQEERLAMALGTLVPLKTCMEETINYTKERKAFGQPLINNQYLHFRLAELETELECLRSLIYRAIDLFVAGQDVTKLASMCKLKSGRLARIYTDSLLQFWGGMGFTNEVLVSRMYRDLRLFSIGGGADEVMLSVICKYMDTLPHVPMKKAK
ncbi:probable acyl-CoA dehydrogenase 6 [Penaeus japonicus]|uniref:probable acyl-CoA dehydrogenase 6 n=1 Tax=Penaeus japonicus TaxID=27405 RepID=UPI001C713973|nr:probable acyl-CoA dehydrogenase 6 [Penaeus japonicus]